MTEPMDMSKDPDRFRPDNGPAGPAGPAGPLDPRADPDRFISFKDARGFVQTVFSMPALMSGPKFKGQRVG